MDTGNEGTIAKLTGRLFSLFVVLAALASAQSSKMASREFTSEDDFVEKYSVHLPKPIFAVLLATKEADAGREWVRDHPGEDGSDLFNAFPANLSTAAKETDYVVVGKGPLTGADNDWFWVVRAGQPKPRVVLFCGALVLGVLPDLHNSLRDIRCAWESPGGDGFVEDYRFNGRDYVLTKRAPTHRGP